MAVTAEQKLKWVAELEESTTRWTNVINQWYMFYKHIGDVDKQRMMLGREIHDLSQAFNHIRYTIERDNRSQFIDKYREWAETSLVNLSVAARERGHAECDISSYNVLNKNECKKLEEDIHEILGKRSKLSPIDVSQIK